MQTEATTILGGRYVLHVPLDTGSMGTVYRATDRFTSTPVALKRVHADDDSADGTSLSDSVHRLGLAHEFQTLASLRHPNIISVLDYGFDHERQPFITMELLYQPQTILDAGRGQPLAVQVDLLLQMLRALTYMHRRGIIHRDLKPSNVLVIPAPPDETESASGKQVKVLDFGLAIARNAADDPDTTSGTLAYMAPEVLLGKPAMETADLYAVGIIACELMGGQHPFASAETGKLIQNVLNGSPNVAPLDISESLVPVLERLLSKIPDDRYPSADVVIEAICEATGQPVPTESAAVRESFLQAAQFVGREAEFAQVNMALQAAIEGKGSAWLIGGESGVGKSRLISELQTLAQVRGAVVLRGQGVSEGSTVYSLWRGSLRPVATLAELDDLEAGVLKSVVPDIEDLLVSYVPDAPELDPAAAQMRLFATIGRVLKRQPYPLVILLEDLHWAGNEDLVLLKWLSGMASELPLLLVGSYRDDEGTDLQARLPEMRALKLDRLSETAITELSGSILGEAGRKQSVVDLLQRETEGNVFFLVEVVRALAENAGSLDQIGQATLHAHVFSGGVRQVVQRRLEHLPDSARPLLKLAAVIGRQIDPALLRAASKANVDTWLALGADSAVLAVQDGKWRFAHDKLREGVLETLADDERVTLHRKAAQAIERVYPDSPQNHTALAFHWAAAGDAAKEAHYSGLAGAQALKVSAYADAARFLERALKLISKQMSAQIAQLKAQLAEAYSGLSRFDEAKALYEASLAAYRKRGDLRASARTLIGLGVIEESHGNYTASAEYFRESLALSREATDQVGEAYALEKLADTTYRRGDFAGSEALSSEALVVNRAIQHRLGIANSLKNLGTVSAAQGEFAKARQYFEESLDLYREIGQKRGISGCLNNLGIIAQYHGDSERALALYADSIAIKSEMGDRRGRAGTLGNMSIVQLELERFEDARMALEEALQVYHSIGDRQGIADAQINLGRVMFAEGDVAGAAVLFVDSQTICMEIGDLWGVALTQLNLGRVAREADSDEQAASEFRGGLQTAWEIQKPSTIVALLVEIAILRAKRGQMAEAVQLLGIALDHPAIEAEYQGHADTLYAGLCEFLPPEAVSAALDTHHDLEAAVKDALRVE